MGKRGKKFEIWSGKERKYRLWVREKKKKKRRDFEGKLLGTHGAP